MSRRCRERWTNVPQRVPESLRNPAAAGGATRLGGHSSFALPTMHRQRVPTGAHDVIETLPVESRQAKWCISKRARGKRNIHQWIKFKLSSDPTEILHCFQSSYDRTENLREKRKKMPHTRTHAHAIVQTPFFFSFRLFARCYVAMVTCLGGDGGL